MTRLWPVSRSGCSQVNIRWWRRRSQTQGWPTRERRAAEPNIRRRRALNAVRSHALSADQGRHGLTACAPVTADNRSQLQWHPPISRSVQQPLTRGPPPTLARRFRAASWPARGPARSSLTLSTRWTPAAAGCGHVVSAGLLCSGRLGCSVQYPLPSGAVAPGRGSGKLRTGPSHRAAREDCIIAARGPPRRAAARARRKSCTGRSSGGRPAG